MIAVRVSVVSVQFDCQFQRQLEARDEAIQRQLVRQAVFAVDDPQHQFSLWLFQNLNELFVVSVQLKLGFRVIDWLVK